MYQPAKWIWGVVPLGLIWFSANQFFTADPVNTDLTVKSVAAATGVATSVPGLKSIGVKVSGRDVHLTGETLDAETALKAAEAVNKEFGVRRVTSDMTVAAVQKPYTWSASRDGNKLVLSGFVPDEAIKKANVDIAAKAFDGVVVDDQQKIAFGAPLGFAAMTSGALPSLAGLKSGKFSLNESSFCVEGEAATPASYIDLRTKMAAMPQTAFKLADCPLNPPTITPYVWGAEKTGPSSVSLTGYVPSDDMRRQIVDSTKSAFPSVTITDLMQPALGAPAGLAALAAAGLGNLSRLVSGKIDLSGSTMMISGQGPTDYNACIAMKKESAALLSQDASKLVDNITCPPAPVASAPSVPPAPVVQPPQIAVAAPAMPAPAAVAAIPLELRAVKTRDEITLSGVAPSDAAKAALLQAAQAAIPDGRVRDEALRVVSNLQSAGSYKELSDFGLSALSRLKAGEMSLAGSDMRISGTAGDPAARAAFDAILRGSAPSGLRVSKASAVVDPYEFAVQADKSGAVVSGYVPDAATKSDILALLEAGAFKGRVTDQMQIVTEAPGNFSNAIKNAVKSLMRLDMGTANLSNQSVTIQGMTCRDLIKSEVETSVRSEQQPGYTGLASVSLRQTGCLIDPPNTCQADLDTMTRKNAILFRQGGAELDGLPGAEDAIREVSDILKKCPAAAVRIEGHTNRDGERYGFDNQRLSEQRAEIVQAELVKRGIAAARLSHTGYGSKNPLIPHNVDEAREKNRRVQFTVAKP